MVTPCYTSSDIIGRGLYTAHKYLFIQKNIIDYLLSNKKYVNWMQGKIEKIKEEREVEKEDKV